MSSVKMIAFSKDGGPIVWAPPSFEGDMEKNGFSRYEEKPEKQEPEKKEEKKVEPEKKNEEKKEWGNKNNNANTPTQFK